MRLRGQSCGTLRGRCAHVALWMACAAATSSITTGLAYGQTPPESPAAATGEADHSAGTFPVSRIEIAYEAKHDALERVAPPEKVQELYVTLRRDGKGWGAPMPGAQLKAVKIGQIGSDGPAVLHADAVRSIRDRIRDWYRDLGLMAIDVQVNPEDIAGTGNSDLAKWEDRRAAGNTVLRFQVLIGSVYEVRTVAQGERIHLPATQPAGQAAADWANPQLRAVNNPAHQAIREGSPVQGARKEGGRAVPRSGSLLWRDDIEEYAFAKSRHPGRRVDVAISASEAPDPGEVTLDYIVSEVRPWYVFAQISNTGTQQTNEWRERFGFVHTQLTGHDDILSLDYETASFDNSSQGATASYDIPVFTDKLRLKSTFAWSDFTASDLGQFLPEFTGSEYSLDEQLAANVAQWRDTFWDVYIGGTWQSITGQGDPADSGTEGTAAFWEPYVGTRLERARDTNTWFADARVMYAFTDAEEDEVAKLGRIDAETDFTIARGTVSHSVFLEPLLYPKQFAEGSGTLANEVAVVVQGQYAFGGRPVAQQQQTVGGLFTVRGYDESAVAADDAVIGSLEYRLHVPYAMGKASPGKLLGGDFRWRPEREYGRADWDLIARAFVDGAWTNSNSENGQQDNLLSAGIGLELQVKQNVSVRVDWGWVLEGVEGADPNNPVAESGDNRVHVMCTFSY